MNVVHAEMRRDDELSRAVDARGARGRYRGNRLGRGAAPLRV